jgi:outer membrane protein
MQIRKIVLTAVVVFISVISVSYGADVAKIGIVDIQKVFDISNRGKAAISQFQEQGKKMSADLKEQESEITKLQRELERGAMVMSKAMRTEKQREINIKKYDLKLLKERYIANLKAREEKTLKEIKQELLVLIEKIGTRDGFLLILEKLETGVLYSPASIDLTDRVIKLYNSEFLRKSKRQK